MKKKFYYIATPIGCGIRTGRDVDSVRRAVLREVGTAVGVTECREATGKDIAWVRGMGGYVPSDAPQLDTVGK